MDALRLVPPLLAALLVVACGSDSDPTPRACLQDAAAYLAALEGAPEQALLDGEVPISECVIPDQPAGELNTVGSATVAAATELNARAQRRPGGKAATRLGFLVGSIEAGAADTGGSHTDLIRRLNSAARLSPDPAGLPAEFERTFGAGYQAAREAG